MELKNNRSNMILGSGGYGTVVKDVTDSTKAIKLMRDYVTCVEAKREYESHLKVYRTFSLFAKKYPKLARLVSVPRPFKFQTCDDGCVRCEYPCAAPYKCAYTMERVLSTRKDGLAEHVILNDDYTVFGGYIMFRNSDRLPNTSYINGKQKLMGPRGAFLGVAQLLKRGLDVRSLAYRMGMLHGLILKAGFTPKDVEFVLDDKRRLVAMDFGMINQSYNSNDEEYDMYVPSRNTPITRAAFETGRLVTQF